LKHSYSIHSGNRSHGVYKHVRKVFCESLMWNGKSLSLPKFRVVRQGKTVVTTWAE
jgi:hypothetical protein